MLFQLMRGTLTVQGVIVQVLACFIIIFLTMPFHEWAHGFVAYKLGDNTAKYSGRLKFNPLAHIDPMGALMILLCGFGWARPVPVNPYNFKNPKAGMAVTALAGPVANLLAATVGALLMYLSLFIGIKSGVDTASELFGYLMIFFNYFISINITLAVFNLIPIPPLDGSKILFAFLPNRMVSKAYSFERYFSFALMALVLLGAFSGIISTVSGFVYDGIMYVAALPFKAFL